MPTTPVTFSFSLSGSANLCSYLKGLQASGALKNQLNTGGDLKSYFPKVIDILSNVQAKAPDEIKADVTTVLDRYKKLNDAYSKYNYDETKALQGDPTFRALRDETIFGVANMRIGAYFSQVCGVGYSSG